jgi:cephalosporin-C deacetylase
MPLTDLSLPQLLTYQGRNPRPADFDAYWAAALSELDATAPNPELHPAAVVTSHQVEAFDLWFTGVGGARIYAKYLRPKATVTSSTPPKKHPAVLQFHGYSGHTGEWLDKFGWPAEGFCYAAMECRGQGGRSEDSGRVKGTTLRGHIVRGLDDPDPRQLAFRQIFLDAVQLARIVMNFAEVDPGRVGCFGASQGGALSLVCAALEPRIRRIAPVYPFLCDYQRVWEMDLAKEAYEELRYFFRSFDPRHERAIEIFTKLGYIDCQHLASRIRADVLMFTGLSDPICPPSSQFAAYNKITAQKDLVVYPDFAHEALPGQLDRTFNFMLGL